MFLMSSLFRYEKAFWPNLAALTYVFSAYLAGLAALVASSLALNLVGVIMLAHGMVIAAYLVHECAHNSIFRKNSYHRWLGELMLWICGASYSAYEDIRHKHVRHHTDRADVVSFDYREKIRHYPRLLKVIQWLEWAYIPAMEVVMHALVIMLPFIKPGRKHRRRRVVLVLLSRVILFAWLASLSPRVLLLYPVAYLLFLTVMRFMDVHQHTYEIFETLDVGRGPEAKKFDREFEQHNTYSNLVSSRYPWLNLLVLNFPYHNAHHEQPGRPWFQLPGLHHELYGENDQQVLSFAGLLRSYHRYRVQRVLNADDINLPVKHHEEGFIGVDGVSFLTTH